MSYLVDSTPVRARRRRALFLGVFGAIAIATPDAGRATSATWNTPSSGVWSTASNWITSGGTASAPGSATITTNADTASFGNEGNAPITISLTDTTRYLGSLNFLTGASAYTITGNTLATGGSSTITPNVTYTSVLVNSGVTSDETIASTLLVNRTTGGSYGLSNNGSGLLTLSGNLSWSGSAGSLAVGLGGTGNGVISGVISNSAAGSSINISKNGTGMWTLTNANTYTGPTTIYSGTLKLDFSASGAPSSNILYSGGQLYLGLGAGQSGNLAATSTLAIVGASGVTSSQNFASTTIYGNSASHIVLSSSGGGNVALNLGTLGMPAATITSYTLDFTIPVGSTAAASGVTNQTNGTLINSTVNGTDFATLSGGNIVAWSSVSGNNYTRTSTSPAWASATLLDVDANQTLAAGGGLSVSDMRFNTAGAYTIGLNGRNLGIGALGQGAGMILMTQNAGGNVQTITSGFLKGGQGNLVIVQNDTASGALLEIDSVIQGYNAAAGIVKSGQGALLLTGSNTYTGASLLHEGTTIISNSNGLGLATSSSAVYVGVGATLQIGYNNGSTGNLASNQFVVNNGTVAFARGDGGFTVSNDILGSGAVSQIGIGTTTLNGSNTYTGATSVSAGTLVASGSAVAAATQTATTASGSTSITVTDSSNLRVGQSVSGAGISTGTYITAINGTTVTLSTNATSNATNSLTFGAYSPLGVGGAVNVNGGTLLVASSSALLYSGAVTVAGGTFASSVSATTVGSSVTMTSGKLQLQTTPTVLTLSAASGTTFSMTGGELDFVLGTASSQIVGATGATFSLTGGTLSLSLGTGFDYANTYTLFSGFTAGTVNGLSISGYDTADYVATLSSSGVLSFMAAVPEPSTWIMIAVGALFLLLSRRIGKWGWNRV